MSSAETGSEVAGIPRQIIEKFLAELTSEKVSPEIVARLKKTLVEQGDISEAALKAALTARTDVHD
jgi:hypothetical protein